ncbi:MAG: GNAT family N-acetyltransferase [Herpetosiphonaceae bacterium]|nr:GNAT family N-acetyltransferase [Herpetosiphonaceae bacterium]
MINEQSGLAQRQRLSAADVAAIHALADACNRHDGLDLKLNWDMLEERPGTDTDDFLFHQDGALIGYLGLYGFGRPILELNGMVHPDHRREGIFSQLYAAARVEAIARSIESLLFICEPSSSGGQAFVRNLGAQYVFSEHKMVIPHPQRLVTGTSPIQLEQVEAPTAQVAASIHARAFDHPMQRSQHWIEQYIQQPSRRAYLARLDTEPIGVIAVQSMPEERFIYGFGVLAEQRGRGYGRQILATTINILVDQCDLPIMLEVETDNQRALGLYESCGFQQAATYEYWRLALVH